MRKAALKNFSSKSSKPLKVVNEELELYTETELQEFSQHTTIHDLEVETKQLMKVENSTSRKAPEAITASTVKPVQDAPKMSEYQLLSFTKDAAEVLLIETTKSVIKLGGKAKGKEKPAQEVAKRKAQRSQVVEALTSRVSRSGRKVKASCKE